MLRIDKILSWVAFSLATGVVVIGPWLYGAWETWWFWPLTVILFLSTACFALRLLLSSARANIIDIERKKQASVLIISFLPFLLYALIRCCMAEVYMDAERSFLLFLLPFLLGLQIILGFSQKQRRILYMLILIDLLCLGAYGLANHFITHNTYVLFAKGYAQYYTDNRATGTFFCPDHFSGIMELALCLGLATVLTRKLQWKLKIFPCVLALTALAGVVLSKSRGGGLSVIIVFLAALIWGLSLHRKHIRRYYRFVCLTFMTLVILLFCAMDTPYMNRFKGYFFTPRMKNMSLEEKSHEINIKLRHTARGHMYAGAFNAWKTAPLLGVGPGMHQNLWPYYNNSLDGNKETGEWPKRQYAHTSYEVHNDWLQLLEEYGIIGLILFWIPMSTTFMLLLRSRKCDHAAGLGGVLALVCMAFHSFGDFNLQMPSTTWLLSAIIALPLATYLRQPIQQEGDDD